VTGDGVFVTGGSGLIGRALVERLLSEGRRVRALARSGASAAALEAVGADVARGDVLDSDSLDHGMKGCRVVYHVAGVNAFCLSDPSPLYRVNVLGSRNMVRSARRAGIERIVYTSSAATLGERRGTVGTEDSEHRGWFLSDYERSKFEAERVVLGMVRENGPEVVSVNPSSVQGPGRASGTGRVLIYYLNGKLKTFVDTNISLVDIDDCTQGHVLAETNGKPGSRYILNGASLPAAHALQLVAGITGIDRAPRLLPGFAASAAAGMVQSLARLRGRDRAPACREMVRTLLHGHDYDGSKANRELGLVYTPVRETLRRTVVWLVDQGLAPPEAMPSG
jgi:dihydroflavonol-4-reductase